MLLAAVIRYGELLEKEKQVKKDRLKAAIGLLGVALDLIPFGVGPVVGGVVTVFADPVANRLWKSRNYRSPVLKLGAQIEDSMRASATIRPARFDTEDFCIQLEKTVRHCGEAY